MICFKRNPLKRTSSSVTYYVVITLSLVYATMGVFSPSHIGLHFEFKLRKAEFAGHRKTIGQVFEDIIF